jgi:hypothetical protein
MTSRSDELTAVHEGGHAVAATLLGREVKLVSVIDRSHSRGRVFYADLDGFDPGLRWWTETSVITQLSGPLAERRAILGHRSWSVGPIDWSSCGGGEDIKNASLLVEATATRGEEATYFTLLLLKTKWLLSRLTTWPAIEGVAVELLKKRVLYGKEVRHLVERAGGRLQESPLGAMA